jgi:hypothetical protein
MSHKSEINCAELKNKKYLTQALQSLVFIFKEATEGQTLQTKGRYGVHENVDILIEGNGSANYNGAIGFRKKPDDTYTAVGDFYCLQTKDGRSVSAEMLKCEVTSHAKEAEVNERLANLMFTLDPVTRKETNQTLEYTLQKWVD